MLSSLPLFGGRHPRSDYRVLLTSLKAEGKEVSAAYYEKVNIMSKETSNAPYAEWLHASLDLINASMRKRNKRYTQQRLAQESGVSQPALSRISSGATSYPSLETYSKISTALDQRLQLEYPDGFEAIPAPSLNDVLDHETLKYTSSEPDGDLRDPLELDPRDLEDVLVALDADVPDWCTGDNRCKLLARYYNLMH